uniref:hypothetical protein n=1 Tax=Bacillus mycoides TaxID=1405 RepID=UPI00119CDF1E
ISLYYLDHLSLGEIPQQFDLTRQALYDNIKRTQAILQQYQQKLLLLQNFQHQHPLLPNLKHLITQEHHLNKQIKQLLQPIQKLHYHPPNIPFQPLPHPLQHTIQKIPPKPKLSQPHLKQIITQLPLPLLQPHLNFKLLKHFLNPL